MMDKLKYNDFVMPFGKYKGCFLMDIYCEDTGYFKWLLTLEDIDQDLKEALEYCQKENE